MELLQFNQSHRSSQVSFNEIPDIPRVQPILFNPEDNLDLYMKLYHQRHNRILVVDDEEFCISAIQVLLSQLGINIETQVDFCITGQEAVNKVKQIYSMEMQYRLILTDFNMPVMDGIKATYKIREFLRDEKTLQSEDEHPMIVGITGHVHQQFKAEGI